MLHAQSKELRQTKALNEKSPLTFHFTVSELVSARFQDALTRNRPEAVQDTRNIPLREGYDAIATWLLKVTFTSS